MTPSEGGMRNFAATGILLLAMTAPAWAVVYTTRPSEVTAGVGTLTLEISRTISPGDEGYSQDEMASFKWYGPNNPYPGPPGIALPPATLVRPDLVRLTIDASLLRTPGRVVITYIADPDASRDERLIGLTINPPPQITGVREDLFRPITPDFAPKGLERLVVDKFESTGGTIPLLWAVESGTLPLGLAVEATGTFVGTPRQTGTFTFVVRLTDGSNVTARRQFTVVVVPPVRIATSSLPSGTAGVRYLLALQATGGLPPLQWELLAGGGLPPGISLDGSGILAGTPTTAGTFNFVLRVSDALSSDTKAFALTIGTPLQITTSSLASGLRGFPYEYKLQATGGLPPLQWSVSGLPAGLAVDGSGTISGTPTAAGTFSVVARASDVNGLAQKTFTLVIEDPRGPFSSLHAATFASNVSAPVAIVAGFGADLAPSTVSTPSAALPSSLAGISVNVRDETGVEAIAPLFFVSAGQINYLVPAGMATGVATVSVRNGALIIAAGSLRIRPVAPGFFTANADGVGVAAALWLKVSSDQRQTSSNLFTCGSAPGSCVASPIDLGNATDSIYLLLFGTGIRGRSSESAVTATVGGVAVPVEYAGPQNEYPGLDQINLGPLPRSLAGRGSVPVEVRVDGDIAKPVTVAIR
jgi:uncharacterized protein (TIGR03437 family)